jgi:putative Ca2+/H+ antiporter (TMEM165/GDT1 family)
MCHCLFSSDLGAIQIEAFTISTASIVVGELGDKTQFLTLILAARLRKPIPVIAGILAATLFGNTTTCLIREWVGELITFQVLRWLLGVSFLAVAAWAIIPDKKDEDEVVKTRRY